MVYGGGVSGGGHRPCSSDTERSPLRTTPGMWLRGGNGVQLLRRLFSLRSPRAWGDGSGDGELNGPETHNSLRSSSSSNSSRDAPWMSARRRGRSGRAAFANPTSIRGIILSGRTPLVERPETLATQSSPLLGSFNSRTPALFPSSSCSLASMTTRTGVGRRSPGPTGSFSPIPFPPVSTSRSTF